MPGSSTAGGGSVGGFLDRRTVTRLAPQVPLHLSELLDDFTSQWMAAVANHEFASNRDVAHGGSFGGEDDRTEERLGGGSGEGRVVERHGEKACRAAALKTSTRRGPACP